jgi:hypothetical protein
MNPKLWFPLFSLVLCFIGCQRPLITDDDQTAQDAVWDKLNFQSERLIQGILATPFELYAITENEFSRFNSDLQLLEKRPLPMNHGVRGQPVLSENTFVRLTTDSEARQVVEFHLTRNGSQKINILADSLRSPSDDFLEVEIFARRLGAFSSDGSLFLLPVKVFPGRHYAFFLMEIVQNPAHNAFLSVNVEKRIDLEELNADEFNLVNIRFLNGNFYVTSQEGAWRITTNGNVERLFSQWMLDFFGQQDTLYVTGYNSFDLHRSTDNGLNWTRLNQITDLKMVETAGEHVFSHIVLGTPLQMASEDFVTTKDIIYPSDASANPSVYYGTAFFTGKYFFCIDRSIYFTEEVLTK